MFHVLLVFGPFIMIGIVAILASLLLFGVVAIVASLAGGASIAAFVKNRTVKRLLIVGFCILLLAGSLCIFPIAGIFTQVPALLVTVVSVALLAGVGVLGIVGIKMSTALSSKIGKSVLIVLFSIVGTAAFALAALISYLALR